MVNCTTCHRGAVIERFLVFAAYGRDDSLGSGDLYESNDPESEARGVWSRCGRLLAMVLMLVAMLVSSAGETRAQQALSADAGLARQALAGCETDLRWLNQISGWQTQWPAMLEGRSLDTAARREAFLELWRSAPAALASAMDSLQEGPGAGSAAPRSVVRRVLEQMNALLDEDSVDTALLAPSRRADTPAFKREWRQLVADELEPAIRRYRDFLWTDYLPRAPVQPGLSPLAGGASCFESAVEWWTTLSLPVAEIERRGRDRIAALEAELLQMAPPELGTSPEEILRRLRAREFTGSFQSRDDVVRHAKAAIERAKRAMPGWFATTGDLEIDVVALSRRLEGSFPAGFYRSPGPSGTAAAYVVNTSRPADRRLLSEVITFHEAIPGHHTSFAVPAATNGGGGAFNSGYAEGWAVYAERLAEEMGLYSGRLDRMGLIAKHLWASSRLVVEPGIHVHGWTRERAISFMLEHTALPREEIEVEVDRYAAMPGQSLAYMLGYLEFERIRDEAERRAGDDFDIREFHDVVLRPGIRPLSEVADDVAAWIGTTGRSGPDSGVRPGGWRGGRTRASPLDGPSPRVKRGRSFFRGRCR